MARTEFNLSFEIHPKADGGYEAISENPPLKIEGATREEVEQQLRVKLVEMLGPEIAAMLPVNFRDKLQPSGPGKSSFTVKKSFHFGAGLSPRDGTVSSTIRSFKIGGTTDGTEVQPHIAPQGDVISSSSGSSEQDFGPVRRTGDGSPGLLMLRIMIAVAVVIAIIMILARR